MSLTAITYGTDGARSATPYRRALEEAHPLLTFDDDFSASGAASEPVFVDAESIQNEVRESHRRELRLRRGAALKFWSGRIGPLEGESVESEEITALAEPYGHFPQGTLVFNRRSDQGRLSVLLGGVVVEVTPEGTNVEEFDAPPAIVDSSPAPPQGSARGRVVALAAVGGVGVGALLGEISTVGSLVGMTMIAANPEVGIPLMIGGQVLSWLFARIDAPERPPLPSLEQINAGIAKALEHEHAKELAEEAASVWSDIQVIMSKNWVEGIPPSDADRNIFMSAVRRCIDTSVPGTAHDNTNKLLTLCRQADPDGTPTGLVSLPLLMWSATVELYCWQNYTLVLMGESAAGKSPDKEKNLAYQEAVINLKDRFDTLVPALEKLFEASAAAQADRLAKLGGLKETMRAASGGGSRQTGYYRITATDGGSKPPPLSPNPVVDVEYTVHIKCCQVQDHSAAAKATAESNLKSYRGRLAAGAATAFGQPDAAAQKGTLEHWKTGQKHAERIAKRPGP